MVNPSPSTRREIDKTVEETLKEAGLKEPPIRMDSLLEHLALYRDYYNLEEPGLWDEIKHKVIVHGRRLAKKIRLHALWFPDRSRIMVDRSLPARKREWASFHDITHSILDWHRAFFLGDTARTLNPDYQEMLEAEANYGASALMFGGRLFTQDALDTSPCWDSVLLLQKQYDKSLVTVLRRYIEHSHDIPMAMMVNTAWWDELPSDQENFVRHFVKSMRFEQVFGSVSPEAVLDSINANTSRRRGGPIGDFGLAIEDFKGQKHEFRVQSFYNTHYVLSMLVHQVLIARG
jgi:hypothetical protein